MNLINNSITLSKLLIRLAVQTKYVNPMGVFVRDLMYDELIDRLHLALISEMKDNQNNE